MRCLVCVYEEIRRLALFADPLLRHIHCYGFLAQGLAPATRRVYAAGQRAYFQFFSIFALPYLYCTSPHQNGC